MSQFQSSNKNFTRILKKYDFTFPSFPKLPRAPDILTNRDLVDVYMAKRRLELVHLLPVLNTEAKQLHQTCSTNDFGSIKNLNREYLSSLLSSGFSSVVEELISLKREENPLILNKEETGRQQSFTADKSLVTELVQGLIACAEAERSPNTFHKFEARKSLGEKMVLFGDFWLARKMFVKTFTYLDTYEDEELDRMRVELWILLSFVCIYHEDSQEIGYDIPTKCLNLARELSRGKPWTIQKTVMNIFVPKPINVYGLRNDWLKIRSDQAEMYTVATTLLHVLCAKKAKFWQREMRALEGKRHSNDKHERDYNLLKDNITDVLTCALSYTDELRQFPPFIALTLRRGQFFVEQGEYEKAMEDFNAMYVLAGNFDDREASAMASNRMGHTNKIITKSAVQSLDYFSKEWELSHENDFQELKADALQDLGKVLLEEGHTWEADECLTQANSIFRETRQVDTPNENDELTWAFMGVSKGLHTWGRFSTLLRTQDRRHVRAIYKWKDGRNEIPMARMPPKWYKPQKRSYFDEQYKTAIPKHKMRPLRVQQDTEKSPPFARTLKSNQSRVLRFEEEEDNTRRLFEFTPTEVVRRPTKWLEERGFENIFDFINASDKPRITPRLFSSDEGERWLHEMTRSLSQMKYQEVDEETQSYYKKRKTMALKRESSLARNFKSSLQSRSTIVGQGMNNWLNHDFRVKSWKQGGKNKDLYKKMIDPHLGISARLNALLDDITIIRHSDDVDDIDYDGVVHKKFFQERATFSAGAVRRTGEADDESEDSELIRKSRMSAAVKAEYDQFDEKSFSFSAAKLKTKSEEK